MRACLLVAHGPATEELSEGLSGFARRVESETGVPIKFAFLEGEVDTVHKVLRKMEAGRVLVFPLFVSSSSYHVSHHLPALLKAGEGSRSLTLSGAFDSSPEFAELVLERAERLGGEALVLLVHGSANAERNNKVKASLEGLLKKVRKRSGFAEVALANIFNDELEKAVKGLEARFRRISVLPLFFFEGGVLGEKVPLLLEALDTEAEVACDPRPLFQSDKIYKWVLREVKGLA